MIVLLEEIREEGLALERVLAPDFLAEVLTGEGPETGFKPAGPGTLKARLDRVGERVLLRADARVKVAAECRRCLAPVTLDVPTHFELNLVAVPPEAKGEGDEEGEAKEHKDQEGRAASFDLQGDDEAFDGREIDLGGIVREQILLALPMDVLCKDECKGLCTVCGQDLNVKECGCQRKVMDPRWAALKDIKLA